MPSLERSQFEHRRQRLVVLGEDRQHFLEGHGTVADRAADKAKALVGELDLIVLEMHVPHLGSDHTREIERRLGDWKGVPGVEDDADIRARLVTEVRPARGS